MLVGLMTATVTLLKAVSGYSNARALDASIAA
jgi:hypothetical protein